MEGDSKKIYTALIKKEAKRLGFSEIGISKAERLDKEAERLQNWLDKGFHGEMKYMENHFDKRVDPRELVEDSKSVISLMYNYYTPNLQEDPEAPKISKYAYGKDYHFVVKDKLKALFNYIDENIKPITGRVFTDSAPVLERDWAQRSGLGWKGKHTLLIHPKKGSYFFLGELIIDLDLEYDSPIQDYCGTCTRCIDVCPTKAISKDGYEMDGSKCISFLTIELKGDIPTEFDDKMDNWMFGCDACQDVCPWNRFSVPHDESEFTPHPDLLKLTKTDWENLDEEKFRTLFNKSPVKRTKFSGLKRNISFLKPK